MIVGQSRHERSPFEFVDMSVKEPWDERWKTQCRTKIKGCDGVIAIVTKNTATADGALWEMMCAVEEGIPLIGIYGNAENRPASLPRELAGKSVIDWTWSGIARFISSL